MKDDIIRTADDLFDDLFEVSEFIHKNPELAFKEFKSSSALIDLLTRHGFEVETCMGGIETSFRAVYKNGTEGPKVGFCAEYDALPDMGHACGHNLIGTISCGAAICLSKHMEHIPGELVVYGTPAEEGYGGKILMAEKGCFKELDTAMMLHPTSISSVEDFSLANYTLQMDFYGKPAHAAAAPQEGINALDAVLLTFQGAKAYKEHTQDFSRIHGIITDGGKATNIIVDHAQCQFSIRALRTSHLEEIRSRMEDIAKGAALMTGAAVEITQQGRSYGPVMNNGIMKKLLRENYTLLDEPLHERIKEDGMGSTDMGNVTQIVPGFHAYISVGEGAMTHTPGFTEACTGERGARALKVGCKALALTGYDLISRPGVIEEVRQAFLREKAAFS